MSDYTQVSDFSAKDALPSGDPGKLIKGSDFDAEFAAIATAIQSKFDSDDVASEEEAAAETLNTKLITPARLASWSDANAGIVGDLQALTDPNADRILFWDDSAGAAAFLSAGTGLAISGTSLALSHLGFQNLTDPNADRIAFWDDSAGAFAWLTVSTGLTLSGTTLTANAAAIDHDSLSGFVANEHINHANVSIVAGNGLTGGGAITTNRTLNVGAGNGISVSADAVAMSGSFTGTFTATGDVRAGSDKRYKSHILRLSRPFDLLEHINGYLYWRRDLEEWQYGVIAQDVRNSMPEAVKADESGMLTVSHAQIVAVLVEAVKELKERVDGIA
jgi:hypothetical protein